MKPDTTKAIDLVIDSVARQSVTYISPSERKDLHKQFEKKLEAKKLDFADSEIIEDITRDLMADHKKEFGNNYYQEAATTKNIKKLAAVAAKADDHIETGKASSYNKADELLFFYDENGNGKLEYKEWLTANYSFRMGYAKLLTADRNKDGSLSKDEIAIANNIDQKLQEPLYFAHETHLSKEEMSFYSELYDSNIDATAQKISEYSLDSLKNMAGSDIVDFLTSEQKINFIHFIGTTDTNTSDYSITAVDQAPLEQALAQNLDNDAQFRKTFLSAVQKGFRFHIRHTDGATQGNIVNGNIVDLEIARNTNTLQADLKKTLLQAAPSLPSSVDQTSMVNALLKMNYLSGQQFLTQMEKVGAFSFTGPHADELRNDFITIYNGSPFMREAMRKGIAKHPERKYHFSSNNDIGGGLANPVFDDFKKIDIRAEGYLNSDTTERRYNTSILVHELAHATMDVDDTPVIDFIETTAAKELHTPFKIIDPAAMLIDYDEEKDSAILMPREALDTSEFIDYILAPETDINTKTAADILNDIPGFSALSQKVTQQNYNEYADILTEMFASQLTDQDNPSSMHVQLLVMIVDVMTEYHASKGVNDPAKITSILLNEIADNLSDDVPEYKKFKELAKTGSVTNGLLHQFVLMAFNDLKTTKTTDSSFFVKDKLSGADALEAKTTPAHENVDGRLLQRLLSSRSS